MRCGANFGANKKGLHNNICKPLIIRARNGVRTHDPQLGKLMLYH
jgi:hypothetical protein